MIITQNTCFCKQRRLCLCKTALVLSYYETAYLSAFLFTKDYCRSSNNSDCGNAARHLSTGFRVLLTLAVANADVDYIAVGEARNLYLLLILAYFAITNLFACGVLCGLFGNFPLAELMRNNGAYLACGNELAAGFAIGVAGIAAFGAGCFLIVLNFGFSDMVFRVFICYNGIKLVFPFFIREELIANRAFPIFHIAFGNAGCCLCVMVLKFMTKSSSFNRFALFYKAVIVVSEIRRIFNAALFCAGCFFKRF